MGSLNASPSLTATVNEGAIDDEEIGLTPQQRQHKQWRARKRQQREELDSMVPNGGGFGGGLPVADRAVVKKLAINALFIGLWYFFAVSISLYNKWMFSPGNLNFKFPLFTTSLHMLVQFILASTLLYFFPSLRPPMSGPETAQGKPSSPGLTPIFYLTRLVPCGSATSLDIGLGNMSLRFISLSFLTMCKSSALGFVLLFAIVFGLETPSIKLILIICTMTLGVVMMVAGETSFHAIGFALIIASSFFSGFRWALTQILLLRHPSTSNPFSTLFLLTPIMFVSLLAIALCVEGFHEILAGIQVLATDHGSFNVLLFLSFPGLLAFCMISSEFALLRRSSVVTLSICGIFKEVITIAAAGIFFNEVLSLVNVIGLVIAISSIACYNYMKVTKMRKEALMEREGLEDDEDDGYDSPGPSSGLMNDGHTPSSLSPPNDSGWGGLINHIKSAFGNKQSVSGPRYQAMHTSADP
ncbi:solute carrier family 35 member C2 [Arthroderma uncinatum]|uniref:solute carrier family 35 member C2 n=1 Tax=Arthroderma uncinatum TaxID=74035 RepID=UPI00144AD3E3|nr:solute carrier family 35 member C2 [Arthroderma uncinatum]KAF3484408.1 solute carrier family 35 member C2 [Arthroderma uncinatum]